MATSSPPPLNFYYGTMETEDMLRYVPGGYHPVVIGEILTAPENGRSSKRQYKIIAKLDYGSNGIEWVAVKISTAMDECLPQTKEIDMLRAACGDTSETQSGSSHVVTLVDHFLLRGPNGTHPVLVTDVVTPLSSLRRRYVYDPPWLKTAVHGLAQGVAHLHGVGIVHGDLHFENVGVAFPQLADQNPVDVVRELNDQGITFVLPYSARDQTPSLPPYVVAPCDLEKYYNKVSGSIPPLTKIFDFGTADAPEVVFVQYVQNIINSPVEPAADVWALGTLIPQIYEIMSGYPLFDSLTKNWYANLSHPPKASRRTADACWASRKKILRPVCHDNDDADALINLLRKIQVLDPELRPNAAEVLHDAWFKHREHPVLSTPEQVGVP
ncbi:kinase-like domain-containing protein [Gymnopilus junonius]|uniref:non-specific serine/threonine protein kinase n=1 Tax=Gymnopilus junonius TaxID=109634 RepID=A0A9P5NR15_GYMJU|nr:kinase-like domain-containing protein [Gymnopilus junonius]